MPEGTSSTAVAPRELRTREPRSRQPARGPAPHGCQPAREAACMHPRCPHGVARVEGGRRLGARRGGPAAVPMEARAHYRSFPSLLLPAAPQNIMIPPSPQSASGAPGARESDPPSRNRARPPAGTRSRVARTEDTLHEHPAVHSRTDKRSGSLQSCPMTLVLQRIDPVP